MPGTTENGPKTGKGKGRARPPAAAKQPVAAVAPPPDPLASDDDIESACGDEQDLAAAGMGSS